MSALNKVQLIGRLGADPELKHTNANVPAITFSLATTDSYKDKSTGEYKKVTDWHMVVFYGRKAELVASYLKKGSQIYVEGKLKTSKAPDGRSFTRVYGTSVVFLGSKPFASTGVSIESDDTYLESDLTEDEIPY